MGYYGRGDSNCYGRGDYYQGDYYRGDPGLLGDIFKGVKKVAGAVLRATPVGRAVTAIGGIIGGIRGGGQSNAFSGPAPVLLQQRGLINVGPNPSQTGAINIQTGEPQLGGPLGTMTPGGFIPGMCNFKGTRPNKSSYYRAVPGNPLAGVLIPKGSVCVRTRRMNPANGRALRRALTRAYAFRKIALKTITLPKKFKKKK
jgi:hypothetical protein